MVFFGSVHVKAWEVDLSRRQIDFQSVKDEQRAPASVAPQQESTSLFNAVFESTGPTQDIVIMNTEKGFVPNTIKLRRGHSYRFHVVNVNEENKNISFSFEAFAENHNTLFGKPKTFQITPKLDGIFSFNCPETAMKGKVVITSDDRNLASTKGN
ncbi:MAG: cupredoxin domain-containing protein [Bdellovibrionales bacterium]|nr:cupredoxin domain-containing protein [Bdellovibrionales bacterium]